MCHKKNCYSIKPTFDKPLWDGFSERKSRGLRVITFTSSAQPVRSKLVPLGLPPQNTGAGLHWVSSMSLLAARRLVGLRLARIGRPLFRV